MLNDFLEKKETFFHYNNKSHKSHFLKGFTHASKQKNIHFFHFLFLIKIRVKII